jgi:outer membrane lipoprotein-sorting protein
MMLFTTIVYADNTTNAGSNTPVLDSFLRHTTFSAEFTQDNYYPGLDNFTLKGKVYIVRPEKAIWDYETPREYYLMRLDSVAHYNESLKQLINVNVNISDVEDPTAMLLSIFLDGANVRKFFNVKETTTSGVTMVHMTPLLDTTLEVVELRLRSDRLENVFSRDNSGSTISINFTKVQQGIPIDPKVFTPTLPIDTKVVNQ